MSVYKEAFSLISEIATKSQRVFPDACDFGAPATAPMMNMMNSVYKMYADEPAESNACGFKFELSVIDEWAVSDRRKTVEEATLNLEVHYVRSNMNSSCQPFRGVGAYVYLVDKDRNVIIGSN